MKVYIKTAKWVVTMAATLKDEEMDYSEAAHVDSQYEYLLKNKDKGITLKELRRKRALKHL